MTGSWIDSFYRFLNQFGFPDPLHAAFVHMPIGLVMGACLFGWLGLRPGWERLRLTARDCAVLALLFWFPTVLLGFMDWRHFYHGLWVNPITMKLVLAGVLGALLTTVLWGAFRSPGHPVKVTAVLYTLCLVTVILLGWYGARLVYGGRTGEAAQAYPLGEKVFATHCRECHPAGGNAADPGKPLIGSAALKSPEAFLALLRKPVEPMPAFPSSVVSDADARELYRYVTNVLVPSGRETGKPR